MSFADLRQNLTAILRYFGSAVIGVMLVWTCDHGVFWKTLETTQLSVLPGWVVVGLLGVLGLLTYFLHRTLAHPWLSALAKGASTWLGRTRDAWPKERDLQHARWLRRGATEGSPGRSIQNGLDEMNAATHFFYCSAWSPIVIVCFLRGVAPLNPCGLWPIIVPVILSLVVGFLSDMRAAESDRDEFVRPRSAGE
jgi:hypothetical protein